MSLHNYEVGEELFRAGPSSFYRGRNLILQNDLMVRRLAIDPTRADDVRETFFREQRHAASLNHPSLSRPLDVFEEDGSLWSVHDYDLAHMRTTSTIVQEDGPFPLAEAARIGSQVCDGLAHMHSRGFVHGKVSPNVIAIGDRGVAHLINLVKSADLAAGIWPLRPAVLGLSPFTAPEEFAGEKPTPDSDLYALAGTFVYWVTSHWPRGGADDEEALQRARDGAPLVDFRGLRSDLPPALADALDGALEPDPAQRHGSAAALSSLLIEIFQRQAAEIPSGFGTGDRLRPTGALESVEIVGRHGAGAFGVVLRAKDPQGDSVLAVKALKPEHRDDKDAYERFLREARALREIDHPNVVRILGVGEERGTPYAVMEFIAGPDLGTLLLSEGTLSPLRAAKLAAAIARGLEAIHREGIIHRDLKPHNVLIADGERPVIADFGVARSERSERMTMTGHIVGTPAYMAPEQFADTPLTASADLFSLGCILHEMISGGVPFPARDPLTTIRAIREGQAAPLPDDTPAGVAQIIQRLLEKDPADRYPDAGALAEALEEAAHLLAEQPSTP